MPDGHDLPDLVRGWVDGWTRSRRTSWPVEMGTWLEVHVSTATEHVRRVVPEVTPQAIAAAAKASNEVNDCLKFVGSASEWSTALQDLQVQEPEWLMSIEPNSESPIPVVPPGYDVVVRDQDELVEVSIKHSGVVAARAQMGVSGCWGVPDQVVTQPDHRRQGLGRVLMATLLAVGHDHDVKRFVLVATPDGRALYERIGWRVDGPIVAAYRR